MKGLSVLILSFFLSSNVAEANGNATQHLTRTWQHGTGSNNGCRCDVLSRTLAQTKATTSPVPYTDIDFSERIQPSYDTILLARSIPVYAETKPVPVQGFGDEPVITNRDWYGRLDNEMKLIFWLFVAVILSCVAYSRKYT